MEDPYYEVRAESAHAAAFFGERLSAPDRFISKLLQLLEDSNIDVCTAAAEALGRLGGEHDALPALLALWDSKFWRMRTAVLRGILHMVERGKVTNLDAVETQVPKFILTSTDFRPHFEIKFAYMRLMESVSRKKEKSMTPDLFLGRYLHPHFEAFSFLRLVEYISPDHWSRAGTASC